jgi:hypothetical protein
MCQALARRDQKTTILSSQGAVFRRIVRITQPGDFYMARVAMATPPPKSWCDTTSFADGGYGIDQPAASRGWPRLARNSHFHLQGQPRAGGCRPM